MSELEQLISEERNVTPQKLVLNMLATASMIRSGKCYQNLMVYLTPTSLKLATGGASRPRELAGHTGGRRAMLRAMVAGLALAGLTQQANFLH